MNPRSYVTACGLAALSVFGARPSSAQGTDTSAAKPRAEAAFDTTARYPETPAKFTIMAGGFLPAIASKTQFSTALLTGSGVNMEKLLGLQKVTQNFELGATFRLSKKQLLTFDYFHLNRGGSNTLEDSIIFGGNVYHAGATLNTTTAMQYYGVTYRYYIWRRPKWEFGAGLGIDAFSLSGKIGIKAMVEGQADSMQKSGSFTAPAPMIGFYGDVQIAPSLFLKGDLQMLYINEVAGYGGSVTDDRISAEWFPFRSYGVGLSYHYVGLTANKFFDNGAELTYKYAIEGPSLYLKAAFGSPSPVAPVPDDEPPYPDSMPRYGLVPHPWQISLGGYGPAVNSQAHLTTTAQSGSGIDLEKKLGLPTSSSDFDIHATYQWGYRNELTLEYFNVLRTGMRTLADTLHFGDSTYVPNVTLSSTTSFHYVGLSYRYYIWQKKIWQLGAGLGIDYVASNLKLGIKSGGGEETSVNGTGIGAAVPLLGVYADVAPFSSVFIRIQAELLPFNISGYAGHVTDDRLALEWFALKYFGIGGGYHFLNADVTKTLRNGDSATLKYQINGPFLYLTTAF
jgi:hypothetical protein